MNAATVAGAALIIATLIGAIVAATVKIMGCKQAVLVLAIALAGTAVLTTGAWLLETGLSQ